MTFLFVRLFSFRLRCASSPRGRLRARTIGTGDAGMDGADRTGGRTSGPGPIAPSSPPGVPCARDAPCHGAYSRAGPVPDRAWRRAHGAVIVRYSSEGGTSSWPMRRSSTRTDIPPSTWPKPSPERIPSSVCGAGGLGFPVPAVSRGNGRCLHGGVFSPPYPGAGAAGIRRLWYHPRYGSPSKRVAFVHPPRVGPVRPAWRARSAPGRSHPKTERT